MVDSPFFRSIRFHNSNRTIAHKSDTTSMSTRPNSIPPTRKICQPTASTLSQGLCRFKRLALRFLSSQIFIFWWNGMRRHKRKQLNDYWRDQRAESRRARVRSELRLVGPEVFLSNPQLLRQVKAGSTARKRTFSWLVLSQKSCVVVSSQLPPDDCKSKSDFSLIFLRSDLQEFQ